VSSVQRWPISIVILHWVTAIAAISLYFLGDYMVELDYYDEFYQSAPFWHKSVGVLLAIVILIRLCLRGLFARSRTFQAENSSPLMSCIANSVHAVLYLLLVLIVASGYLISSADGRPVSVFGWFDVPSFGALFELQEDIAGQWHEWIANVLMILVGFHVLAALKHHFIDKDGVMRRMLGLKS